MPRAVWQASAEIIEIGRRLYERGMVTATEGNISCRLDRRQVLCTPTLMCKGLMKSPDLCVVLLDGTQVSGQRRKTSEILLHLELYRANPDIQAVVHCHPPHVTAFAVSQRRLPEGLLPEAELFLGDIPLVPYETPGTPEFARLIQPHAMSAVCAILKNHGAVAWGDTLEQAFWRAETLEAYCRVAALASRLGPVDVLNDAERSRLRGMRDRFTPGGRAN